MRIYLAARYSRRTEMLGYMETLEKLGHEVTSRWLKEVHDITNEELKSPYAAIKRTKFAWDDYEDVKGADWVISFTEEPRAFASRGGRHVELGMAIAWGKRCFVVGPRENVFHCLPLIDIYPTLYALLLEVKP